MGLEYVFIWGLIIFLILTYIYIIFSSRKKREKLQRARSYKCLDSHVVQSRAELILDNFLYKLGIRHSYGKTIHVKGKPIKYDFYLPEMDIYIEYWGLSDKSYLKRKYEKLRLYKKGNLKLVSVEDIDLADIYSVFPRKLSKFFEISVNSNKHCPNCGKKLDIRF